MAFSVISTIESLLQTLVVQKLLKKEETMTGQAISYIRVSTIEQNTDSQKAILSNIKIDKTFEERRNA